MAKKLNSSHIVSLLAIVISLAALGTGVMQARIMSSQQEIMASQQETMVMQQKASVWPYVAVMNEILYQEKGSGITISIENKGVGPAIVGDMKLIFRNNP